MTNGSSQGLFVIVTIVIFGIFVVISYLLFRDKLQTGLADIFDDSITESQENSTIFSDGTNLVVSKYISKTEIKDKEFTLYKESTIPSSGWGAGSPVGLSFNKNVEVPYGYKIIVKFDIYAEKEVHFFFDMNANNKENPDGFVGTHSTSFADNFGDTYIGNYMQKINSNTWTSCEYGFTNNSINNLDKVSISDYTYFGLKYSELEGINSFKIRNVEYKVVKA